MLTNAVVGYISGEDSSADIETEAGDEEGRGGGLATAGNTAEDSAEKV